MLTNTQIRQNLRRGEMKEFAKFLDMTPEGLRVRLNNQHIKLNLSGQYAHYLSKKFEDRYSKEVRLKEVDREDSMNGRRAC